MIENSDFETFLYISKSKYQIFVYDKNNFTNLYNEKIKNNDEVELNILSKFLDDNIFKIEKLIKNFIRNIILIIEDDKILDTVISFKKKNYDKKIYQKHLENALVEVKDIFRENYQDQTIMHMIVLDNDKNENNDDDYLFLEVNFISITNNLTFYFDKLLAIHQIKIKKYMSAKYIKSYIGEDLTKFSMMANKLNNGLNKNEVQLVSKNVVNRGFFEKFFQLFS